MRRQNITGFGLLASPTLSYTGTLLMCQRVRAKLEMQTLARRPFPALNVKRRSSRVGRPQPFAFPSRLWIVNPPIQSFSKESDGIRHSQHHPLAVLQRQQRILAIAGRDWHVLAQAKCFELIHPIVLAAF